MTRAGDPTAIEYEGISFVTTELVPIMHLSPIVTLGRTQTFCPSQHPSPIVIGNENYHPNCGFLKQFTTKRNHSSI